MVIKSETQMKIHSNNSENERELLTVKTTIWRAHIVSSNLSETIKKISKNFK